MSKLPIPSNEKEHRIFEEILEHHSLVAKFDHLGKFTHVNKKFCEISKYSKDEILGQDYRILDSNHHSKDFFKQIGEVLSKGEMWRGEIHHRAKDGSSYSAETTILPLKIQNGKIFDFKVFQTLITEKKEKEKNKYLTRANNFKQALLNSLEEGVLVIDNDTRMITTINHSFFQMWNVPDKLKGEINDKQLINWAMSQLKAPEFFIKKVLELYERPFEKSYDKVFLKNGKIFERSSYPVVQNKQAVSRIWLFRDITQKVIQKKELEEQKNISFHNAKLASIGQLAAGVGHEINNPLSIIQGQINLLRKNLKANNILNDQINIRVEKTLKSVDRIANIVKGLRNFARTDDSEMSVLNISEVLLETKDMLFEIFENEGVDLIFDIQDDFWVNGNWGRLQQVFENILNNSKDALRDTPKKEVRDTPTSKNNQLEIKFFDTGSGVSDDLKESIFEPFFTTKEINQGTGIGLSIASTIIKEHLGKLSLYKNYEKGACFVVSLPEQVQEQEQEQVQDEVQEQIQQQIEISGRVLIVDDEDDIREILKDMLGEFGLNVESASNGHEALEQIQRSPDKFDLILSDMKMPVMNGPELARSVKKLSKFSGGFLFITGGINVPVEEYKELVDGILTKPFDQEKVLEMVKSWI